jgi:hypothetical protein
MLGLDPDLVAAIAVGSAAVSVVLLGGVVVLALRLRRLRRQLARALGDQGEDVLAVLGRHDEALASTRSHVAELEAHARDLRERLRGSISRVGLVRYDAFDDMGGALSFSAALLDERGDGMVISAINGRTETRCYSKAIVDGDSEHNLSDEEVEAIDAAIEGRAPATLPPGGRRRRRRSA